MNNPFLFTSGKPVNYIGKIFGTPLCIQGANWVPLNQLCIWILFTWQSIRKHTSWNGRQHLLLGGLQMGVLLGSEWCHNIAHVAAARAIGKPVDAMRIIFGMPVLIYREPEHPSISPRQHIIRSLAGPVFNFVLLVISKCFQRATAPGSPAREVADVAAGMNTFITFGSLVPVPVFDGGPILKWSLIARGASPAQATAIMSCTNLTLGSVLSIAGGSALRRRRWLIALILSFLGALALAAGYGKIKN